MPQSWCEPVLDEILFHFFCHSVGITSRVCYTWWGLKCNNEWKRYSTLLCGKNLYFFSYWVYSSRLIDLGVVRTTLSVLISELLSLVNILVKGAETFLVLKIQAFQRSYCVEILSLLQSHTAPQHRAVCARSSSGQRVTCLRDKPRAHLTPHISFIHSVHKTSMSISW